MHVHGTGSQLRSFVRHHEGSPDHHFRARPDNHQQPRGQLAPVDQVHLSAIALTSNVRATTDVNAVLPEPIAAPAPGPAEAVVVVDEGASVTGETPADAVEVASDPEVAEPVADPPEETATTPRQALNDLGAVVEAMVADGQLSPRAAKFLGRVLERAGRMVDHGRPLVAARMLHRVGLEIQRAVERGFLSPESGQRLAEAVGNTLQAFEVAAAKAETVVSEIADTVQGLVEEGTLSHHMASRIGGVLRHLAGYIAAGLTDDAVNLLGRFGEHVQFLAQQGGLDPVAADALSAAIDRATGIMNGEQAAEASGDEVSGPDTDTPVDETTDVPTDDGADTDGTEGADQTEVAVTEPTSITIKAGVLVLFGEITFA